MNTNGGANRDDSPEASIAAAANMLSSEVGEEGTVEIFELFVRDARARAEEAARAHVAEDAPALHRAAHTFASVCRTVGAIQYATILEELEDRAQAGDLAASEPLVIKTLDLLPEVIALVEREMARLREKVG